MRIICSNPGRPVAQRSSRTGRRQSEAVGAIRTPVQSRRPSPTRSSLLSSDRSGAHRQYPNAVRRVYREAPRRRRLCLAILLVLAVVIGLTIGSDLVHMVLAGGRAEQTQLRRDLRALGKPTGREPALGGPEDASGGAPRADAAATDRPGL